MLEVSPFVGFGLGGVFSVGLGVAFALLGEERPSFLFCELGLVVSTGLDSLLRCAFSRLKVLVLMEEELSSLLFERVVSELSMRRVRSRPRVCALVGEMLSSLVLERVVSLKLE